MIVIVDYGVGTPRSVHNMLVSAGIPSMVSADPTVLRRASRLILPGVGHFRFGMESLASRGLIEVLEERVIRAAVPILGICLGGQLLGRRSEEGAGAGLGWVPMETVAFDRSRMGNRDRVPHMGWSETRHFGSPLFSGIETPLRFYYVHSYHFRCYDESSIACTAEYGYRFVSGVVHQHIIAVQFHPEKSHTYGQRLLTNFASMAFA